MKKRRSTSGTLFVLLLLCLLPVLGLVGSKGGKYWSAMFPKGPATLGADLELVQGAPYPSFSGALLGEIEEGGPASRAGLQPGDLVEYFYGAKVNGPCDLDRQLLALEPGQEVTLFLQRGGGSSTATVELADALDLYEKGCDAGRAASCYRLGVLYDTGKGLPKADPVRGRQLFEQACQGGSAKACAEVSGKLLSGTGAAADVPRGLELARKACEGGSAAGCAQLAHAYSDGLGVPEDETQAFGLSMDACEMGDTGACVDSGLRFERLRDEEPVNGARALTLFERACDLGDSRACTKTGLFYERGQDTRENLERARALYRRACDGRDCHAGDLSGCFRLGLFLRGGLGGERDETQAAELFRRACNGGHEEACQSAAALQGFPSAAAPGSQ